MLEFYNDEVFIAFIKDFTDVTFDWLGAYFQFYYDVVMNFAKILFTLKPISFKYISLEKS